MPFCASTLFCSFFSYVTYVCFASRDICTFTYASVQDMTRNLPAPLSCAYRSARWITVGPRRFIMQHESFMSRTVLTCIKCMFDKAGDNDYARHNISTSIF
jgi:hypothetical protein